jgi:IS30 family transposase
MYNTRQINDSQEASKYFARLTGIPSGRKRTLAMDNRMENAQHQEITATLDTKCFFAHPYASWGCGTNEHINDLILWYLPKEKLISARSVMGR